jgi:hypothetical protein
MSGLPGVTTGSEAVARKILATINGLMMLPGGGIIDGAESRDLGNSDDTDVLRAGLLMGKITSSGKWAPSIIGTLETAYDDEDTELDVGAAAAAEIVRRIGTSGNITVVGPPTAAGTVAVDTVAFSAVNTTTGILTVADQGKDYIAGSLVCAADGSQVPRTLITDQFGIKVTDEDDDDIDVQFARLAIAAQIDASQIINYPSDSSLISWIKTKLNTYGNFIFDDDYVS